ncbi:MULTISPECIES: hypothetical protein [unclassified Microcoleus]
MVRGLTKVRSKAERYVCAKLGDRRIYCKHPPKIQNSSNTSTNLW